MRCGGEARSARLVSARVCGGGSGAGAIMQAPPLPILHRSSFIRLNKNGPCQGDNVGHRFM